MKNKKNLHLAIALAISSMPLFGVAEAARGSMYGGESVGDDVTIEASANAYPSLVGHAFGIYTNGGNASSVTTAGDRLTLITSGQAADGIRSNPSGNSDWQNASGTINVGDDLTITVSGNSADGLNINGSTVLNIGDNATINTLYNGELKYSNGDTSDGAHAVRANFHATINIGDGLTAGTLGESSHAVYAAQGRSTTNPTGGSKINIGKGAVLSTAGDGSHTVMMASNNGKIVIEEGAEMTTLGDGSHGVAAYADTSAKGSVANGAVEIGAGSTIATAGDGSHGVFANMTGSVLSLDDNVGITTEGDASHGLLAQRGVVEAGDGLNISVEGSGSHGAYVNAATGSIEFLGGATIDNNDNDGYAIYADKGTITGTAGNSTFNITGNMYADNSGSIDLDMDNNSVFTGSTALANSGTINLNLKNNSYWHVTSSSEVSSLHVSGGSMVNLSHEAGMNTVVTVDDLSGSGGVFKFNTELDSEANGDKLVINSSETGSTHYVHVNDLSLINGEVSGEKKLHLITDNSSNASFVGEYMDTGGLWDVLPTVERGDTLGESANEWYLTKIEKKENGNTETINDGFASDYSLWRATNDTLRKRLGDIRSGEHGTDGVWARMYHGKLKGQSYTDKYHTYQLGYDKTRYDEKNGQRTNGIVLERSEGKLSYTAGKGETGLTALGLYTTWFGNKGHYTDIVLRAGHLDHKMNTYGEYAERSDYDNAAYSISFEYGRQKNYEKGWFFTPQAQITLGRMNSVDFTTERGTKIDVDGLTSAIGRIGFEVGRKISPESSYYFKLGAFHEFDGDRDVSMVAANGENLRKRYDNGDTWYEFGMGAQVQLSRNTHFYGDIERSFGGDTKKEWQVNTGIRWEF